MTLTEAQARNKVITEARKHVGYNPGKYYSIFGEWYGSGWKGALWCAAFGSYVAYAALGYNDAVKAIGYEATAPNKRGYIWTVAFRQWLMNNGTKVSLANVQSGDYMFFKYPTADNRNTNPVNHVDVIEANHYSKGYITTIGGNTPKPGTAGDPSNGRGCWRHNRSIYDSYIVGCYRPNWKAITSQGPKPTPPPPLTADQIEYLELLDYAGTAAGVKAFQKDHNLTVDGIIGTNTGTRLEQEMSKALDAAVKQINAHTTQRTAVTINPITRRETGSNKKKMSLDEALDLTLRRAAQAFNTAKEVSDVVGKIPTNVKPPTEGEIAKAILATKVKGFTFEWWLRQGLIPDSRVVDKGSLAWFIMELANANGVELVTYTPDGPAPLIRNSNGTYGTQKGTTDA